MTILTAKYTSAQSSADGLNTTPPNLNDAMGLVGSDPVNRISTVSNYITGTYPNFSISVSSTQAIASFSASENPEVFNGVFATSFTSTNVGDIFSQISGTVTGFTSGTHGALTDRYSVSGISIDAHTYFNTATWANILTGGDTLIGGVGNDELQDYGVNNIFRGLGGNDTFIAAAGGVNSAVMRGKVADYSILATNNISHDGLTGLSGFTVDDSVSNRDGFTQLVNINRLSFTDTMVALDTGANQTAGNAYLLYQAAFNRTPDTPGLGYWIAQMDKGANVITGVAENFILSNEFKGLYGSSPTVDQFTNLLYVNVLHRSADAAGLKYWEDQFAGTGFNLLTQAQTLNNFAISNENQANAATQIAHGIHYQAYVG